MLCKKENELFFYASHWNLHDGCVKTVTKVTLLTSVFEIASSSPKF